MQITRFGRHYPKPQFVAWRAYCFEQLKTQKIKKHKLSEPCAVTVDYTPGDKRRRDVPGMLDALWHVFEKYEIVKDDKHLGGPGRTVVFIHRESDKLNPRVEVKIECF